MGVDIKPIASPQLFPDGFSAWLNPPQQKNYGST